MWNRRQLFLGILVLVGCHQDILAQPIVIDKVEPPNWWVNMTWNRVQLMTSGNSLHQIKAAFDSSRIRVSAVHTVPNAHYAFIDIEIPPDVAPGVYRLTLRRGEHTAHIEFPIMPRNSDPRRHRGFGPRDVVYLITPDRFANGDPSNDRREDRFGEFDPRDPYKRHGGDLEGIIDHLDYLADLGVTALWLNPVLENDSKLSYHGYKTTDYYRIDPRFGTNADYRRFVEEAHKRGLKVIFDHINNHIGINHPWLQALPTPDWLNGSVEDHLTKKHYKLSIFDPHADASSVEMLQTFWFVDEMPDLNQKNPFLANYLIQNSLWWIEFSGMDGMREDTYPYPHPVFLSQWEQAILTEYPHFNIVGEIWAESSAFISRFQKGTRFPRDFEINLPAVMDFPLMLAYREFIQGTGKLQEIYKVLADDFLYADANNILTMLDNHDTPRAMYLAQGRTNRVKLCLSLLLTLRGIPQILYGTEIGMVGGRKHVELRADFPGGFPGDTRSAFRAVERTDFENHIFEYLRTLLHLRKIHPALSTGKLTHLVPKDEVYMAFKSSQDEDIWIIANGNEQERRIDFSEMTHWFDNVKGLRNLLTRKDLDFHPNMELRIGGVEANIYLLLRTSSNGVRKTAPSID